MFRIDPNGTLDIPGLLGAPCKKCLASWVVFFGMDQLVACFPWCFDGFTAETAQQKRTSFGSEKMIGQIRIHEVF